MSHVARTYNQDHIARKYTPRQAPLKHLLELELPLGIATRSHRDGESLFHHDRSAPGGVAEL
jgi:hypothetical protein